MLTLLFILTSSCIEVDTCILLCKHSTMSCYGKSILSLSCKFYFSGPYYGTDLNITMWNDRCLIWHRSKGIT